MGASDGTEVLAKAQEIAQRITAFEFRMQSEHSDGRRSNYEFVAKASRFRGSRVDVVAGKNPLGGPPVSANLVFAFNDAQEQCLEEIDFSDVGGERRKMLTLTDGAAHEDAGYKCEFPLMKVYRWLRGPAEPSRWDVLVSDDHWERVRKQAVYLGIREVAGMQTHGIRVPQVSSVVKNAAFEVWLAPELGYVPLMYERKLIASGEVASVVKVESWKMVDLDGESFGFPTCISFSQNDLDGRSRALSYKEVIEPETLKVNQPVDESLFTIVPEPDWVVHDNSEVTRTSDLASMIEHPPATFSPPESRWRSGTWVVLALVFAACSAAAAWKLRQSA
jgi:hypothetical protein